MRMRAVSVLLAVFLGGCGGVVSTAPASDEVTSRVDERLVGFWRVDYASSLPGKTEANREDSILVIGRKKGAEKTFELLGVTLHGDQTIESSNDEFDVTTINQKDYASLKQPLRVEREAKAPSWFVVRYEMPDADTLRVFAMDEKAVAADVKAGTITGNVSESKATKLVSSFLTVELTASTTVLRAYLELHADTAFAKDRLMVLRRLHLK